VIEDTKAIEQIKQYSVLQNRRIYNHILEQLEKGNAMENQFTTSHERLEKKMQKNLNMTMLDLRATITDTDYKVDKFLDKISGKFEVV